MTRARMSEGWTNNTSSVLKELFERTPLPTEDYIEERMTDKDQKNVVFDYQIGDIVILRPVDGDKDSLDLFGTKKPEKQVQYRVLSRVYEELTSGSGMVCYAVRHIDTENPGGGKIYKFQEEEIMKYRDFMALAKLAGTNSPKRQEEKDTPYVTAYVPTKTFQTSNAVDKAPF